MTHDPNLNVAHGDPVVPLDQRNWGPGGPRPRSALVEPWTPSSSVGWRAYHKAMFPPGGLLGGVMRPLFWWRRCWTAAADGDVAEAEAAIERLSAARTEDGLAIRAVTLLRLRALLARAVVMTPATGTTGIATATWQARLASRAISRGPRRCHDGGRTGGRPPRLEIDVVAAGMIGYFGLV
jgi:hypothetical protein